MTTMGRFFFGVPAASPAKISGAFHLSISRRFGASRPATATPGYVLLGRASADCQVQHPCPRRTRVADSPDYRNGMGGG